MKKAVETNIWTVNDAAEYLGVTVVTLKRYIKFRELPCHRVNNKNIRFLQSEIDAWILTR